MLHGWYFWTKIIEIKLFNLSKLNDILIYKIVSIKKRRVKQNSQEWFYGIIADEIKHFDKLIEIIKKSK